jgi:hypothetical protein
LKGTEHLLKRSELTSSKGPEHRLAHLVSDVTNPLFVAVPTFLVIALTTAPDLFHAVFWWAVAVFGISLAPFLFVLGGVRSGHFSDHHVSVRQQRFLPLLFGLGCMAITWILLSVLGASRVLIATVTAGIVACCIAILITRRWKISLHLVGMAGAVTVLVLLFGPFLLLLGPLVALVAWARWQVGAHTVLQAVAGTVLAVGVTLALFWVFGVL